MRPVSKTIRLAAGAFASSAAIAPGELGALASRVTLPLRSTTKMCVSFIEISNPAKYSMIALLFTFGSRSYRPPENRHLITPCCKSRGGYDWRKNRIRFAGATNQSCNTELCGESMLRGRVRKILLQQYLPRTDLT